MTIDEENNFISGMSAVSGVPVDQVKAVVDAQLVVFMRELGIANQSNTFYGKIALKNGRLVLVSVDERVKEFMTRHKLAARMISEVPSK